MSKKWHQVFACVYFLFSMPRRLTIFTVWILCFSCLVYADRDPIRFGAIGDMGCGCPAQEAVADEMLQWYQQNRFTFVLTTGDNIYGDDFSRLWNRRRGGNKALFYERFDRYYNPLRNRGVLFFATLGNHDLETRNGRDLIEDRRRFNILSKTGYYYFSPDPKLATFVALNTEALLYTNENSPQLKWLQKVLSESKSTWKIVFGHHPLYSPPGSHRISTTLQKLLEPILVRNGVNIYIAGHNHFYARMKPQHGIIHLTTGGGGRHIKTPGRTSQTEVIARAYHFMYFEVT
jgi:3',5'-cyclic AMP phosphodiesterase CpdA